MTSPASLFNFTGTDPCAMPGQRANADAALPDEVPASLAQLGADEASCSRAPQT